MHWKKQRLVSVGEKAVTLISPMQTWPLTARCSNLGMTCLMRPALSGAAANYSLRYIACCHVEAVSSCVSCLSVSFFFFFIFSSCKMSHSLSSLLSSLRSGMLRRGWIFQVIWDIHVSLPLSLPDSPLVPLGHHLPPRAPPIAPARIPPPSSPAPSSGHPRREERRASPCKYAWMEVSVASRPAELPDLWPGDLRGSWDHIRSPTAAGGRSGGALHDHGAR